MPNLSADSAQGPASKSWDFVLADEATAGRERKSVIDLVSDPRIVGVIRARTQWDWKPERRLAEHRIRGWRNTAGGYNKSAGNCWGKGISPEMPVRKNEATEDLRKAVQAVEDRADRCYENLQLLKYPANVARWALLTAMAQDLETRRQRYGSDSGQHNIGIATFDHCTAGFKFIFKHGRLPSKLAANYSWVGALPTDATKAFSVSLQYMDFENLFPVWHRYQEEVELLPSGRVRFHIFGDSSRQRQVIAFQQRTRPEGVQYLMPYGRSNRPESLQAMQLLGELYQEVRKGGKANKFSYNPREELIEALWPKYQERLDENFRRPESFQLNGYSLGEFKKFYIALLVLCAIHEYVCYPSNKSGDPIPISSLVLVKSRRRWLGELSEISGIPTNSCDAMIRDLTLDAVGNPGVSMCIHPFVLLDNLTMAVAPQFPLSGAVDDNILRYFSYTFPDLFSSQNMDKEAAMRDLIREAAPQYLVGQSIRLPDKTTEIHVLLADEASSTVVLGELKWVRKYNRTVERSAQEEWSCY